MSSAGSGKLATRTVSGEYTSKVVDIGGCVLYLFRMTKIARPTIRIAH